MQSEKERGFDRGLGFKHTKQCRFGCWRCLFFFLNQELRFGVF